MSCKRQTAPKKRPHPSFFAQLQHPSPPPTSPDPTSSPPSKSNNTQSLTHTSPHLSPSQTSTKPTTLPTHPKQIPHPVHRNSKSQGKRGMPQTPVRPFLLFRTPIHRRWEECRWQKTDESASAAGSCFLEGWVEREENSRVCESDMNFALGKLTVGTLTAWGEPGFLVVGERGQQRQ